VYNNREGGTQDKHTGVLRGKAFKCGDKGGSGMKADIGNTRIYIRPGSTDLRKACNGLAALVQEAMKLDPFNDAIYLFCNKKRKLLKGIWWDKTGFWLCQKRLEKERWPWPKSGEEAREIRPEELALLLKGIDFFKAHKTLEYKIAA
jgi:transposase